MTANLTTSIALCTYNGERFLREQLDSYARQTRLPDEVVVCDDGSKDRTLEILEEWAGTVPFPVRIVRNEQNLGYAQNFGKAVSLCTGNVIFLSDQDDIWEPEKIAAMVREFENDPALGVLTSDGSIIDAEGKIQTGSESDLANGWRYDEAMAFGVDQPVDEVVCTRGCATAIRREVREVFLPIPEGWAHDVWLTAIAPWFWKTRFLPGKLFRYRLYDANTSTAGSYKQRMERIAWKRANYYWHTETQYWAWLPAIGLLKERIFSNLPECERTKPRRFFKRLERYYSYRSRSQRNFLIYGVFWFLLVFQGTYFRFPFPWKSMFYDLKTGIKSTFVSKKSS